jgi:hypothetical protein
MEDGWYFPQCMGKLTILHVVAIIVVILTMATKSKRLNNNDHDNSISMTRQYTNMILALISCVMALHDLYGLYSNNNIIQLRSYLGSVLSDSLP